MSISDAMARVAQIQSMFSELQTQPAAAAGGTSGSADTATGAVTGPSATGATTDFATQLAQASGAYPTTSATTVTSSLLTSTQQQFASRLAADTGLDPTVVGAWLMSEENGSAAQSRMAQSNNDWLNIGYTDSATYGSSDTVWSNPISAADATAGWLKGQNTIPGYGTASAGVQAILQTVGQPPAGQIAAIQSSGWASSGYPDLPSVYTQMLASPSPGA